MSQFFLGSHAVENFDDLAAAVAEARGVHLEKMKALARAQVSVAIDTISDDLKCAMDEAAVIGKTQVTVSARVSGDAESIKLLDTPDNRGFRGYIEDCIQKKLPKIFVRTKSPPNSGKDGYQLQVNLETTIAKSIVFHFSWYHAQFIHDCTQQCDKVAPAEADGAPNAKRARKEQSQNSQAKGQEVKQEPSRPHA